MANTAVEREAWDEAVELLVRARREVRDPRLAELENMRTEADA